MPSYIESLFHQEFNIHDAIYKCKLIPSASFLDITGELTSQCSGQFEMNYNFGSIGVGPDLYCNPMLYPTSVNDYQVIDKDDIKFQTGFFEKYHEAGIRRIFQSDLDVYAEALIKLGKKITATPGNCTICPLRGAIKPVIYLQKMGLIELDQIQFLPFTNNGSGAVEHAIKKNLLEIIDSHAPHDDLLKINLIDTAIGGHGVNRFAQLFSDVNKKINCIVNLFILHPANADLEYIRQVAKYRTANTNYSLTTQEVNDLIVEDWDAAIGLDVKFRGADFTIKSSITPGRVFLIDRTCVSIIESPDISNFVDLLYAKTATDAFLTSNEFKFNKVICNEYIRK